MRGWSICFFLNLFVWINVKAQQSLTAGSSVKRGIAYDSTKKIQNIPVSFLHRTFVKSSDNFAVKRIPSSYYFNSLGFFCRKELQIEKTLRLPLRFRLGSVAYTDQMEGKGQGFRLNSK